MVPLKIWEDLGAAYSSPKLLTLGLHHRVAFEAMEWPAPILYLAQELEARVFDQHADPLSNERYEAAFEAELARELNRSGFALVDLRKFKRSDIDVLRDRFDSLETWIDTLAHGPGHHGRLTHPLQIAATLRYMRRLGFDRVEMQAWYRSMGSAAVSFGQGHFERNATHVARRMYGGERTNRSPWVITFERWHGPTAPVNLSTLLSVAMGHRYWGGDGNEVPLPPAAERQLRFPTLSSVSIGAF